MKFLRMLAATALMVSALFAPAAAGDQIRIVETSDPIVVKSSDHVIGLRRTTAPRATTALLPRDVRPGRAFVFDDLAGNAFDHPVTVIPPRGHTINGRPSWILKESYGHAKFRFYGHRTWSAH
jgi:hypothetical protein